MKPSRSWALGTNSPREERAALLLFITLALAFAILALAPSARAQAADAGARALQKKAMEEDYLSTDFAKAQDKLEKAIAQCGADKCAAPLRSRLRRDLGVVQIGGGIDREKGIGNFVEALQIDPTVTLEADIKTKDLDAAFAEAQGRVTGAAPPRDRGTSAGQPRGDFVHTPSAEQTVRTALPVYVEYEGAEPLARVVLRYKGVGMTDWKPVELNRMGDRGYGGLIPCGDVQTGTIQYYVQGFNAANDPVATGGDRNDAYHVPIRNDAVADPPHLPNAAPPTQCQDTADCPPGFPGCKKAAAERIELGKEGGEYCEEDSDCKSNKCQDAKCTEPEDKRGGSRFWFGVAGALDYTFVPTADDVCKLQSSKRPVNEDNYYCVRSDGVDYPTRATAAENDSIALTRDTNADKVAGGAALGNVRVMLSADYAVNGNLMLGARVGLVLNNYPGNEAGIDGKRFSAPIHLEARLTYVFGDAPIFKKGLAPYANLGVGVAQFETRVPVEVIERRAGENGQAGTAEKRDVDAWHLAGPAFLMVGGGGRYAISSRFALMLGLRANLAFVNAFAPSIGPELGGAIGF